MTENCSAHEKHKADLIGKAFVLLVSVLILAAMVFGRESSVYGLALGLFAFGVIDLFKFLTKKQ